MWELWNTPDGLYIKSPDIQTTEELIIDARISRIVIVGYGWMDWMWESSKCR
jgi:hypothetical protein